MSEDRSCRDGPGAVGVTPVARLYRSAGLKDLDEPANVRSYIMASTQHAQAQLPLPAKEPFLACQQQPNPNPHNWTMRALLTHLTAWVKDGTNRRRAAGRPSPRAIWLRRIRCVFRAFRPTAMAASHGQPSSSLPTMIRCTSRTTATHTTPQTRPESSPRSTETIDGRYGNLVAQVDADGNDLGGIRDVFVAVPIGTYTGWNQFNKNFFEDASAH